ncbi:hypothetical protein RND81_09G232000 [Saponaria officinalis]|uniref:Uncharacterized protein n=1 Tax=Saponaria officinalis TaxID=3572 RepID=A0AAW1IR96_SAPOF
MWHNDFLSSGDTMGLTLQASMSDFSFYQSGWPRMDDRQFALHKMPIQVPTVGHEYAGVWGGTFGWPPGKPGLNILALSHYVLSPWRKRLVTAKILQDHYWYNSHPKFLTAHQCSQ